MRVSVKLCGVAFVAVAAAVKLAQVGQHTGWLDVCLALALGAVLAVVVFPAPAIPDGRLGWPAAQWLHGRRAQLMADLRALLDPRALLEPVHVGAVLVVTPAVVGAVAAAVAVVGHYAGCTALFVSLGQFLAPMGSICVATAWLTALCVASSRTVPFVLFMFAVVLVSAMLDGVAAAIGRSVGDDAAVNGLAVMGAVVTSFGITAGVLVWQLAEKAVLVPVWGLGLMDLVYIEFCVTEEGRPLQFVRVQDPIGPVQDGAAQVWLTSWLWEEFVATVAVADGALAPVAAPAEALTALPPLPPPAPMHHPSARRARKIRRRVRERQDCVPEDACCVCLESLKWTSARPEVARLVCSHHLHSSCLEVMQSRFPKCPLCLCPVAVRYCVAMAPPSVP